MKRSLIFLTVLLSLIIFFSACTNISLTKKPGDDTAGGIIDIWNASEGEYYEGTLNIGYVDLETVAGFAAELGMEIRKTVPKIKVLSVTFDKPVAEMKDIILDKLSSDAEIRKNIRFVEPSFKRELIEIVKNDLEKSEARAIPDLEEYNWGSRMVKAPEAWAMGYTGAGVVVAVVDTGIDMTHPDLINQCIGGYAPWSGAILSPATDNSQGAETHGTHVAGTIAAENNGFGITGVAYNSRIMSIRIFDADCPDSYIGDIFVADGLVWAVDNGAQVTNNSWGGKGYSNTLLEAFNYGLKNGVVHVSSMGNDHVNQITHPSGYPGIINVAASTATKGITHFSSRGQWLTVSAPGDYTVLSTVPLWDTFEFVFEQPYALYGGTSMASPHVTAVVALLIEKLSKSSPAGSRAIPYTPYTIRKMLIEGAEDIMAPGFDEDSGWGLVQADASLMVDTSAIGNGANLTVTSYASGTTDASSPVYVTIKPKGFTAPDYFGKTNNSGILEFICLDPGMYDLYFGFVEGLNPLNQAGISQKNVILAPGDNTFNFTVDIH